MNSERQMIIKKQEDLCILQRSSRALYYKAGL